MPEKRQTQLSKQHSILPSKTLADLKQLQLIGEKEGYQCLVGALIIRKGTDNENMSQDAVYVQKRSKDRKLFPDCWDILGGHVDAGEDLVEALAREIKEESGWELTKIVKHLKTVEWKNNDGNAIGDVMGDTMREFVFIVTVEGDLDNPEIEQDKFSEFRWVSKADLDILKENRTESEQLIFELASLALENSKL